MRRALIICITLCALHVVSPALATCEDGSSEGAACCWNELLKITTGQTMSQTVINNYKGGQNPIDFWTGGGSQNIPVLCRTADYWKNGDQTWFNEYFDDQNVNDDAGGHQGSEILSPLYSPYVVAAVMAGLEKATQLGHTTVQAKARSWLRTYWALNALGAYPGPYDTVTAVTSAEEAGTHTDPAGNAAFYDGLSTPIAGQRRLGLSNDEFAIEQAYLHVGQYLLTLALDWQPRRISSNNVGTDGYYNALRLTVYLAGGSFEKNGTLEFGAVPSPVAKFGLSATERQQLVSFVSNLGASQSALNSVVGMIGHGAKCAMTFLRTTAGTSVWFGDDQLEVGRCNNNKAPWFGVTMTNQGQASILTPDRINGSLVNRSRRNGNQIEAWTTSHPDTRLSIGVIGGNTSYKVVWGSAGPSIREFNPPALPAATITANDPTAIEGGTPDTGQFTVSRSGSTAAALTVNLSRTGTAANGVDYQSIGTSVTIPQGSPSIPVTVTPLNDSQVEGNETVVLSLAAGSGYTVGTPASATVTVLDDESPIYGGYHDGIDCNGTFGWAWDANRPTTPISVDLLDGSTLVATVLADAFRQDLLTAGFGDGRHGFGFTLPASVRDGNVHTITARFSGTTTPLTGSPKTIQCLAQAGVSISATDSEASETPTNGGLFTLSRTGGTAAALTVNLSRSGSATNASDYVSIPTTFTFGAGQSTGTIPVTPLQDTALEGIETVVVGVAAGSGYVVGSPASATVTLLDDDYTPCSSGGTKLCLLSGRFEVTLSAVANGTSYPGQAVGASNASGAFWLFSQDNVEVGVKVLDGGGLNGNFWVYHGAATDLPYTVTVKDRANPSRIKTYSKATGSYCGGGDTGAFTRSSKAPIGQWLELAVPAQPVNKSFTCAANSTTACVLGGRFQVRVKRGTVYQPVYGATASTAGFWFFSADNLELFVKVLDGTAFNGKYWVFFGSMTGEAYTIEVTDSVTEATMSYSRTTGQAYCGGADAEAF